MRIANEINTYVPEIANATLEEIEVIDPRLER